MKTHIEINLANGFIRLSKSQSANAHFLRSSEPLNCLGRTRHCVSSCWIWQICTIRKKLVKAGVWRQSSKSIMVNSSIKPCTFQYSFPSYVNKSLTEKLNKLNRRSYTESLGQPHGGFASNKIKTNFSRLA